MKQYRIETKDLNNKNENGETLLFSAVKNIKFSEVKMLVEMGANINIPNREGWTPVHYAIEKDLFDITLYLYDKGANLNINNIHGEFPLMTALKKGRKEMFKSFVLKGADVNNKNKINSTVLHYAVEMNDIPLVTFLKWSDHKIQDINGNTPLHIACLKGFHEICVILLKRGAMADILNNNDQTPFDIAMMKKSYDLYNNFVDSGMYIQFKLRTIKKIYEKGYKLSNPPPDLKNFVSKTMLVSRPSNATPKQKNINPQIETKGISIEVVINNNETSNLNIKTKINEIESKNVQNKSKQIRKNKILKNSQIRKNYVKDPFLLSPNYDIKNFDFNDKSELFKKIPPKYFKNKCEFLLIDTLESKDKKIEKYPKNSNINFNDQKHITVDKNNLNPQNKIEIINDRKFNFMKFKMSQNNNSKSSKLGNYFENKTVDKKSPQVVAKKSIVKEKCSKSENVKSEPEINIQKSITMPYCFENQSKSTRKPPEINEKLNSQIVDTSKLNSNAQLSHSSLKPKIDLKFNGRNENLTAQTFISESETKQKEKLSKSQQKFGLKEQENYLENPGLPTPVINFQAETIQKSLDEISLKYTKNVNEFLLLEAFEEKNLAKFEYICLNLNPDINFQYVTNDNMTLLQMAIKTNEISFANFLISNHADVNLGKSGSTPLVIAIKKTNNKIVKKILKNGAVINDENFPLRMAVVCNNVKVVKLLIKHGANINQVDEKYKGSVLHTAVYFRNSKIIPILLSNGIDINLRNFKGFTALEDAYRDDYVEGVSLIENHKKLQAKCTLPTMTKNLVIENLFGKDSYRETHSIQVASTSGIQCEGSSKSIDISETVLKNDILKNHCNIENNATLKLTEKSETDLRQKSDGEMPDINVILKKTYSNFNKGLIDDSYTYLHAYSYKKKFSKLSEYFSKYPKESSKNINIKTVKGYTPLHLAVKSGHSRKIKFLISNGASPYIENDSNNTPLFEAILDGRLDLVEAFLITSIDLKFKNKKGETALKIASQQSDFEITQVLINYIITENSEGYGYVKLEKPGCTNLNLASKNGDLKILQLLFSYGINLDCVHLHVTPLYMAVKYNQPSVVEFLLKNGADFNIVSNDRFYPLHSAVYYQNIEIIQLLVKNGDDIKKLSPHYLTPLQIGAKFSSEAILELLLDLGADVNQFNRYGKTALYYAATCERQDIVDYLIYKGANVCCRGKSLEECLGLPYLQSGQPGKLKLVLSQNKFKKGLHFQNNP